MKKGPTILILAIVVIVGIALGAYFTAGYRSTAGRPSPRVHVAPNVAQKPPEEVSARIYMVGIDGDKPVLKPLDITIPSDEEPVKAAIQQLVDQESTADLGNPVPEGTELLDVQIDHDLARIGFNKEFVDAFAGGPEDESLLIEAIKETAGQFKGIHKIEILSGGKPVTTLGHLDISEPIIIEKQD